jgi:hypothetical protein
MNNTLLGVVAFSLSLAPLAAQANPAQSASAHVAISVTGARPVAVRPAPAPVLARPPAPVYRTVAVVRPPPPAFRVGGRYEWQPQNQFVPAHREVIRVKGKHHHKREVRWIPAHYESSGQWVWVAYTVPAPRPPVRIYPAHR